MASADAIIVGAGIIGSSIAWRLAQDGLSVVLLDAGVMGAEASWAGAGMLAPGGEVDRSSQWANFALESQRLYADFVAELERESSVPIDYRRCGAIEIAMSAAEWTELTARAERQRTLGIHAEVRVEGREMFYPDDAIVDPRDVLRALRHACTARGVRIVEQMRVTSIEAADGGDVQVETAAGMLTGAAAVLAAGAWSNQVAITIHGDARFLAPTMPIKGHLIGYSCAPGSLPSILRNGHTYVLQRANGFTIAGASTEQAGFDRCIDDNIVADIVRRAETLWPPLRSAQRREAWNGFRPATATGEPAIGRVSGSRLWTAYGHYRNGILLAPATAARVSAEILATTGTREFTSSAGMDSSSPGRNRG